MTEVPLTKSQKQHIANLERQATNRRRKAVKQQSIEERDAKLREINNGFQTRIKQLQVQQREALTKVWDEWKKERSTSESV